jgi:hypothetical protein
MALFIRSIAHPQRAVNTSNSPIPVRDDQADFGYNFNVAAIPDFIREARVATGAGPASIGIAAVLTAEQERRGLMAAHVHPRGQGFLDLPVAAGLQISAISPRRTTGLTTDA